MDLSKDAKLLWIYFITKCDHAGIIKVNEKLCRVQTDIKDLDGIIKQLCNRLVTVSEHLYFIPKYIDFQYPGFPNSKVRQQLSAVDILIKYGLFTDGKVTVSKQLDNSYVNDTVNDTVIDIVNVPVLPKIEFSIFWDLYSHKVGDKTGAEKTWSKLSFTEQTKIIEVLPAYLKTIKDKQFQPHPATWLHQRRWENEDLLKPQQIEKLDRNGKPCPSKQHVLVNGGWTIL